MARFLAPSDYGKIAIASSVSGIVAIFASGGLSIATLQRPNITESEASSMYWLNIFLGGALFLVLSISGPLLSYIYNDNDLTKIMPWLGLSGFIASMSVQKSALLARDLKFGKIAICSTSAQAASVAAAIGAAAYGMGFWALVVQQVSNAVFFNIGIYFSSDWKPTSFYSHKAAKPLIKFGTGVMLSNAIDSITSGLDVLVIGLFQNAGAVGIYNRAQNILKKPLKKLIAPINNVARSALFKKATNQKQLNESVFAITGLLSSISGLILTLSICLAKYSVTILLGDKWLECIPIFLALTPFAFVVPCTTFLGSVLISKGNSTVLLRWKFISLFITVLGLLAGVRYGLIGMAISYATTGLLVRMPLFVYYACKHTDVPLSKTFSFVTIGLISGALASAVPVFLYLTGHDLNAINTILVTVLSIAVYLLAFVANPRGRTVFRIVKWLRQPQSQPTPLSSFFNSQKPNSFKRDDAIPDAN